MELCIMCDSKSSSSILGMEDDSHNIICSKSYLLRLFSRYFNLAPEQLESLKCQLGQDFPFCIECELVLTNLSRLQSQLTKVQNDISRALAHIASTIMNLVKDNSSRGQVMEEPKQVAIHNVRKAICTNYTPRVVLQDYFVDMKSGDPGYKLALWGPPRSDLNSILSDPHTVSNPQRAKSKYKCHERTKVETDDEQIDKEHGHDLSDDGYQENYHDDDLPIKEEPLSPEPQTSPSPHFLPSETVGPIIKRRRGRPKKAESQITGNLATASSSLTSKAVKAVVAGRKKGRGKTKKKDRILPVDKTNPIERSPRNSAKAKMEAEKDNASVNNSKQRTPKWAEINPEQIIPGKRRRVATKSRQDEQSDLTNSDLNEDDADNDDDEDDDDDLNSKVEEEEEEGKKKKRRRKKDPDFDFDEALTGHKKPSPGELPPLFEESPGVFRVRDTEFRFYKTPNQKNCFTCKVCNLIIKRRDMTLNHYHRVHETEAVYPRKDPHYRSLIEESPGVFRIRDSEHRFYSVPNEEDYFKCGVCSTKGKKKKRMVDHYRLYHDTTVSRCPKCNRSFLLEITLKKHMEKPCRPFHPLNHRRKLYKDLGGGQWTYSNLPYEALAEPDPVTGYSFKCGTCGELRLAEDDVTQHIRKYHMELQFVCETCGKGYDIKSQLARHQLFHQEVKSFMCEECGNTFRTRGKLNTHRKHIHGIGLNPEDLKCLYPGCGRYFRTYCILSKHRERTGHRVQRKPILETCPICNNEKYRYRRAENLKKHMETCKGPKTYPCSLCDTVFKSKEGCIGHMERVHGANRNKITEELVVVVDETEVNVQNSGKVSEKTGSGDNLDSSSSSNVNATTTTTSFTSTITTTSTCSLSSQLPAENDQEADLDWTSALNL